MAFLERRESGKGMGLQRSTVTVSFLAAVWFAAAGLVFAGSPPAARRAYAPATARAKPAERSKSRMPFHVGEKLFYEIGYMSMPEAATAELKVMPHLDFYGHRAAWHFQAVAHTEDPLRYVLTLDDQFDSYAAASTLATLQYELYLHERGKDSTRKLSLNENTPGADRIDGPGDTRDPLAALYALRANNWQRRPVVRWAVYDGTRFYQMAARIVGKDDSVTVPAGTFRASRISVSVSSRETSQSMQFSIWLANDAAHTPVEVDATVPIGTVKAMLLRVK